MKGDDLCYGKSLPLALLPSPLPTHHHPNSALKQAFGTVDETRSQYNNRWKKADTPFSVRLAASMRPGIDPVNYGLYAC